MIPRVCIEDVREGTEIASLTVLCDPISQVKWAGINKDYAQYHFDKEYAKNIGMPSAIVNGRFKVALLAKMLMDWAGIDAIKKLSCRQRRMDITGDLLTCKGVVTNVKSDNGLAECEIWTQNPSGEKTVVGTALLQLASRSK